MRKNYHAGHSYNTFQLKYADEVAEYAGSQRRRMYDHPYGLTT